MFVHTGFGALLCVALLCCATWRTATERTASGVNKPLILSCGFTCNCCIQLLHATRCNIAEYTEWAKKVIPTLSNFGDAMKDTSSLPMKSDEMR